MVAPYEVGMSRQTDFASTARAVRQRVLMVVAAWALLLLLPAKASASFLSPEMEDTVADWLTVFVLILVPVVGISLFWLVHILPEQIAHKRHHPQFEAIRTLCLLSLVFGGLLWPIAWIWAYTKPVMHQMAYGTDKSDEYHAELKQPAEAPAALPAGPAAAEGAEKH
jgi:CBS domain containing-hemolysin-like protein